MTLTNLYGSRRIYLGPSVASWQSTSPTSTNGAVTLDAANEAAIFIGRIETSDLGSHTIDTTGSSSIGWRSNALTFANAGTTVKVGIAPVDTANGPPARASNAADVISFDVAASFTGGGGGITANAWQTSVPTTGTKTIANGDLVAIAVQMTARGGADSVVVGTFSTGLSHRPTSTTFLSAAYSGTGGSASNQIICFSDGAFGWISGGLVLSTVTAQTFNSGSATKEYGQLFKLPFPAKIFGIYGWLDPDADTDFILYSDPTGTPVPEKTLSIDSNVVQSTGGRYFEEWFPAPYSTTADQLVAAVFKPGGSNISAYYMTLGNAAHRAAHPWGTVGYGISRASGAFADANSSLDHYLVGLIIGAADDATGSGGAPGNGNMTGGLQ